MWNLNLKRYLILCSLAIFCLQTACTTNKYREPISKFQAASAVVSANARKSFTEINRLERTVAIKKLVRDGKPIKISELQKVQPFTEEEIQARLDALDRLNEYVDLLVSIANSDAPQNISKSATDLTGSLSNLINTVHGLGNTSASGSGNSNSNFKTKTDNAFGVASVVVSEILDSFVKQKIKEGLEKAILKGDTPINELIDAIGGDLTVIYLDQKTTFETERADLFKLYNNEISKMPPDQQLIATYKEQIISNEDTLETLASANPTESLTKMKKAHTKIVILAKTNSPANFAEAVAAIEDFAAAAKRLGDAVDKLKNS